MWQFEGDIAVMLEIFAIAAGLVLVHAGRRQEAGLLKAAGGVLLVGGVGVGICTLYYWSYAWLYGVPG